MKSDSAVDFDKYRFVQYGDNEVFGREIEDLVCFDKFSCDNNMRHLRSTNLGYEGVLGLAQPDDNTMFQD